MCTENLDPDIMVMKPAKDGMWRDISDPQNDTEGGRIDQKAASARLRTGRAPPLPVMVAEVSFQKLRSDT
jgi:hypothetical protein